MLAGALLPESALSGMINQTIKPLINQSPSWQHSSFFQSPAESLRKPNKQMIKPFLFFFFVKVGKNERKKLKKKKSACLADLALSEVHTSRRERSWTTFVMQTGTFGYQMQDVVYPVQRGTYFACLCWLLSIKPCCDSATLKINNLCYSRVLHYAPFFKRRSFPERHLLKRREGNKTLANVFIIITWRQSNHGTLEDQLKYL